MIAVMLLSLHLRSCRLCFASRFSFSIEWAGFRSQGAAYWSTILLPVILIAEIDFTCNIACPSLCQPGSCANAQCQPCRSASIGTGQQLSDGEFSPSSTGEGVL